MTSALGNRLVISVPEIDVVLNDFDAIRLYRAATRDGAYDLVTGTGLPITLVADTAAYAYQDTTGAATDWYKTSWYNTADATESDLSDPQPAQNAPTVDLLELVRRAAQRLGCYALPAGDYTFPGPSGTTTATGTTTTVVSTDYADAEYPTRAFSRWYLLLDGGAQSGEERRVAADGLNKSTGTFTMARAFSGAPGTGVDFSLFAQFPGSGWATFVNEILAHTWVPTAFWLGGLENVTEYPCPDWIQTEDQIQSIARVLSLDDGTQATQRLERGIGFDLREEYGGGVTLLMRNSLSTTSAYEVQALRTLPRLSSYTDALVLAPLYQDIVVVGAAALAARQLSVQSGQNEDRRKWAQTQQDLAEEWRRKVDAVNAWDATVPFHGGPFIGAPSYATTEY